jgi:hypothetical protein
MMKNVFFMMKKDKSRLINDNTSGGTLLLKMSDPGLTKILRNPGRRAWRHPA